MTLSALIQKGGLRRVATAIPATDATEEGGKAGAVARVATVAVATPSNQQLGTLSDPVAEARRQQVLELLAANLSKRLALVTDTKSDPEAVILALAIRGQATCEFRIPRHKYDGLLLLDLIERYGVTVPRAIQTSSAYNWCGIL
jgi:hypothetical protein